MLNGTDRQEGTAGSPVLNIVTVYENPVAALNAQRAINPVVKTLAGEYGFAGKQWSTSVLRFTALRAIATREAAAADVVFFAFENAGLAGIELWDWLNEWPARPEGQPGAIVLVWEPRKTGGKTHPVEFVHSLSRAAAAKNFDFIWEGRARFEAPSDAPLYPPLATPFQPTEPLPQYRSVQWAI